MGVFTELQALENQKSEELQTEVLKRTTEEELARSGGAGPTMDALIKKI